MTDGVFRIIHRDPECSKKICLEDYEGAFARHQENMFSQEIGGNVSQAGPLEEFRRRIWGDTAFADRVRVRVSLPRDREMFLRLSEIESGSEVLYADVKTLMEMGAVEFWVPDHLCRPGGNPISYLIYPIRNPKQFQEFIRDLDRAGPMHREAMGNIFGLMCMDASFTGSGSSGEAPAPSTPSPISLALESLRSATLMGESSGCPDDDVDYFDEDTGKAVCYEPEEGEASEMGQAFSVAAAALGAGLSFGATSALSKGAMFSLQSSGELLLQNSIEEFVGSVQE